MLNRLLAYPAVGAGVGLAAALAAGTSAGIGAFAAAGVTGTIFVVLLRSHRARSELERALAPIPIRRAARDDRPSGPR